MMLDLHVDWQCPSCGKETRVSSSYGLVTHQCPKLGGMVTPYVRKGESAKHEIVMRQDYVGDEKVQTDDQGRPVMAIQTTRDQGQDVIVFPPTVTGRVSDVR
jgi:predicted RNA-binding Zn-ribbon protein involved in translation (DUF1610 family)